MQYGIITLYRIEYTVKKFLLESGGNFLDKSFRYVLLKKNLWKKFSFWIYEGVFTVKLYKKL